MYFQAGQGRGRVGKNRHADTSRQQTLDRTLHPTSCCTGRISQSCRLPRRGAPERIDDEKFCKLLSHPAADRRRGSATPLRPAGPSLPDCSHSSPPVRSARRGSLRSAGQLTSTADAAARRLSNLRSTGVRLSSRISLRFARRLRLRSSAFVGAPPNHMQQDRAPFAQQ
jgi:hypothetical protein